MSKSNNSVIKPKFFWISIIIIFLFPIIIHFLFKIRVPDNWITVAVWDPESIFEYGGVIISSLIVYFTVIITLNKNQEENEKTIKSTIITNDKLIQTTIEENKKILANSNNEIKYQTFTKAMSEILTLLPNFTHLNIDKIGEDIVEDDAIRKIIIKLDTDFIKLDTLINQLQISLPSYARKFFQNKFIINIYELDLRRLIFEGILTKYNEHGYLFNFNRKSHYQEQTEFLFNCQQLPKQINVFIKFYKVYCFVIADNYFNEEIFLDPIYNAGELLAPKKTIDDIINEYTRHYC